MNKSIRAIEAVKYLVCGVLLAGLSACDKTGFAYDNIVDGGATQYIVVDTPTMKMSTIYMDSIPTSNFSVALCGTHTDPVFGTVSASSYWKVRAYNGNSIPDLSQYDSIVLIMRPRKTIYGDTLQTNSLSVYKVTERIQKPVANIYLYSNYSFATSTDVLGTVDFPVKPTFDTLVRVKLNDVFGQDLFDKCKLRLQTVTNQEQFEFYLPGLAIKPNSTSKVVSSFRADDSLAIRMYYHNNASEVETSTIDFALYDNSLQFNHIDVTRPAGSPLEAVTKTSKVLSTEASDNKAYVQPITNVMARVDMPYLKNISQLHRFFKVMRATLTVKPEKATYQYPYLLPKNLNLVELDNGNAITGTLISPSTGAVQTGDLSIDYSFNLNTTYTYDITNYVIAEMAGSDVSTRGLGIVQPRDTSAYASFDRVILGDSKNKFNNLQVKIYYLQYE